jgi:two-component system response regulator AtoC
VSLPLADASVGCVGGRREIVVASEPRTIVLVGIAGEMRRAIECLATERGFSVSSSRDRRIQGAALCVFACEQRAAISSDLARAFAGTPCVAVVDRPDPDLASTLLERGASDVVVGSDAGLAERCLRWARPDGAGSEPTSALIGSSSAMRAVKQLILDNSATDATILITGETGTGKGLVARICHALSSRASGPLLHVDCATLSPSIIESELFGHDRGAFTGAVRDRKGRFELVGTGTLFLDEIGELGPELQSKLLRVLQDREFERLGGVRTLRMNGRVIAATSRNLAHAITAGRFRPDLYYRLAVLRIHVPPLRDRHEDIVALVDHLLERIADRLGVTRPEPTSDLLQLACSHPWPGNVRELANTLERLMIQRPGHVLDRRDLEAVIESVPASGRVGAASSLPPDPDPGRPRRAPATPETIASVLLETGGNVSRAARRLSVPRSTLRYWIEQLDLQTLIPAD